MRTLGQELNAFLSLAQVGNILLERPRAVLGAAQVCVSPPPLRLFGLDSLDPKGLSKQPLVSVASYWCPNQNATFGGPKQGFN